MTGFNLVLILIVCLGLWALILTCGETTSTSAPAPTLTPAESLD